MAWTEYVPGPNDGGSYTTSADARLSGLARSNIGAHNGSGLSHADVDKMLDSPRKRCRQRGIYRA